MSRRRPARDGRAASGFTLVEILTVISIIVVLIGLLFVAIKYARNSAARSTTAAQMDTLRGMLGELDSANHLSQAPTTWLWYNNATGYYDVSVSSDLDFWNVPFDLPSGTHDSLDSPGDVRTDSGLQSDSQRNASFAVLNTQLAMQLLASVPANRTALDKLPANSKMLPNFIVGASVLQATASPATTFLGLLKEDGTDGVVTNSVNYAVGMHITYNGRFYAALVSRLNQTPTPNSTANWLDETASPRGAPVLLDGWGNPIIFVPATGLRVKKLNGEGAYNAQDATQDFIIISPEGSVAGQGTSNPYVVRPGRPFFASAGPDGDFTKGDDNLYSFEN